MNAESTDINQSSESANQYQANDSHDLETERVEDSSSSDNTARRMKTGVSGFLGWACVIAIVLGVLLRLTVRDRFRMPAMAFYMLSPASMTLLAGAGIILFKIAKRRWLTGLLALSTICCGTWTYGSMFHSNDSNVKAATNTSAKSSDHLRLMFWNVCRGRLGWDGVVSTVRSESPDVMVLAELRASLLEDDFFEKSFPQHPHRIKLPRGVYVLSRFPFGEEQIHHRSWRGLFHRVLVHADTGDLNLLVADLPSPPYYKRKEPIELLTEMAFEYLNAPAVIVGDMNTPVDSVFLSKMRTKYSNAFESAGNGYHATWPMPLPVIAIDQMWTNKFVRVSECDVRWTVHSDHRPLVADLEILP